MKSLFLSLLTLTLMTSCSETSKEDRMRENIEAILIPELNDPSSYEFVSMNINKTFSYE
jgi:hypothetical protein